MCASEDKAICHTYITYHLSNTYIPYIIQVRERLLAAKHNLDKAIEDYDLVADYPSLMTAAHLQV